MIFFRLFYSIGVAIISFLNYSLFELSTYSNVGNKMGCCGAYGSGRIAVKQIEDVKGILAAFKKKGVCWWFQSCDCCEQIRVLEGGRSSPF